MCSSLLLPAHSLGLPPNNMNSTEVRLPCSVGEATVQSFPIPSRLDLQDHCPSLHASPAGVMVTSAAFPVTLLSPSPWPHPGGGIEDPLWSPFQALHLAVTSSYLSVHSQTLDSKVLCPTGVFSPKMHQRKDGLPSTRCAFVWLSSQ